MTNKDPYMIDPNDEDVKKGIKSGGGSFKLCPKLNKEILGSEKPCKVCDAIRPLWGYPKGSKERDIANDKKAKATFYLPVCFKGEDKPKILEVGKNVGNDLILAFQQGKWLDVAHPKTGIGRDLTITKSVDGGYNRYKIFPSLDKADWDVPQSALDNVPNLDNIVEIATEGGFNENNYFLSSKMKVGDTITFRLLPPNPEAKIFKRMAYLWKHWGVTEAEINGEVPVDLTIKEKDDLPFDVKPSIPTTPTDSKEPCFGNKACFNEKDDECKACKSFKKCMAVVASK